MGIRWNQEGEKALGVEGAEERLHVLRHCADLLDDLRDLLHPVQSPLYGLYGLYDLSYVYGS
ncbi:hypothetical protein [Brockia lithotrophica]|uniref:hypothetical protein n=1 Tax=Brockia lithotrophica TaxID=933949 RepID=UPI0011C35266|nr:hypothetical protein [Brockia lithotrophica]